VETFQDNIFTIATQKIKRKKMENYHWEDQFPNLYRTMINTEFVHLNYNLVSSIPWSVTSTWRKITQSDGGVFVDKGNEFICAILRKHQHVRTPVNPEFEKVLKFGSKVRRKKAFKNETKKQYSVGWVSDHNNTTKKHRTSWNTKHQTFVESEIIPHFEIMAASTKMHCKKLYTDQLTIVKKAKSSISTQKDLPYSTGFINFEQTYGHLDLYDYEEGLSQIYVTSMSDQPIIGGELLLINYKIAVSLQPGDQIWYPAHKVVHATSPFEGPRVTLIAVLRNNISKSVKS